MKTFAYRKVGREKWQHTGLIQVNMFLAKQQQHLLMHDDSYMQETKSESLEPKINHYDGKQIPKNADQSEKSIKCTQSIL